MDGPHPELIDSPLGWSIERNGRHLKVNIVRLATEPGWSLEVVNDKGTSTVWDDLFETDRQADAEFRRVLAQDGFEAFLD